MVELESAGELTRREVATFLREFANELDDGVSARSREVSGGRREELTDEGSLEPKRMTFIIGGDSATVTLPDTLKFEVEVESRSPMFSSHVSQEIELELSWEIENPDEDISGSRLDIE